MYILKPHTDVITRRTNASYLPNWSTLIHCPPYKKSPPPTAPNICSALFQAQPIWPTTSKKLRSNGFCFFIHLEPPHPREKCIKKNANPTPPHTAHSLCDGPNISVMYTPQKAICLMFPSFLLAHSFYPHSVLHSAHIICEYTDHRSKNTISIYLAESHSDDVGQCFRGSQQWLKWFISRLAHTRPDMV